MTFEWSVLTKLRCKLLRGSYTQATCLAALRNLLPIAHMSFVQCRDTELWNKAVILGLPVSRRMRTLVYNMVFRDKFEVNAYINPHKPRPEKGRDIRHKNSQKECTISNPRATFSSQSLTLPAYLIKIQDIPFNHQLSSMKA